MANKATKPNFPLGLESQEQSIFQEGLLNNGVMEHGPDAVMTVPETIDASGIPSAIRYNATDDQFEGYYADGGWMAMGGGGSGRWVLLPHADTTTLQLGRAYLVDNSPGASTVVFPSPKRVGDSITLTDLKGKFSTYPLSVDGGGNAIYGSVEPMTISTDNVSATFTWTGDGRGWIITAGVGLGQGRVYSREIYSQILSAETVSITLSTQPSIVDVYVNGKRLKESLYTLNGYDVQFDPHLVEGDDVQIIQYIPIQLGNGGNGGGGGTVITWIYNGGAANGGETEITLDIVVDSVSEIYIRGSRQQIGLGFEFDPETSKITLADALEQGDDVVVVINGDPTVYNQIDRTPWEVARANNVSNAEVILSTDKQTALDGKTVIYDVATQTSWGIPEGLPTGVKITSVSPSGVLVYSPGTASVQMEKLGAAVLKADLATGTPLFSGAMLVKTIRGLTVQQELDRGRIVFPELFSIGLTNPTDDDLWDAMFSTLTSMSTGLSTELPYTIDLRGKEYTLTRSHKLDMNVNICNGTIWMSYGGQIILGEESTTGKTRRYLLKELKVRYTGTKYYPDALLKIARCFNSQIFCCDFWAGDSTAVDPDNSSVWQRARYGLWLGSKRAWGCGVFGGDFYGGDIPCRIGFTNDHTGLTVTGGATFHHGRVGNLLCCNPSGAFIGGINIEHSENGAWGLCVTSSTNGGSNPAHGVEIVGIYFYNNANGTTGTVYAPAGILIGYDAPGTMDFDVAGQEITSLNTAHTITVRNCNPISPKQLRAVKMRGLFGLKVMENKYTMADGELYGITIEGTAARSRVEDNRNQSSGLADEVEYTSTNKPTVGNKAGTFLPSLNASVSSGSLTYSTRGGDYSISNGMCLLSMWLTVGSITTQPDGDLTVSLPVSISSGRRAGCGVQAINIGGTTSQTINSVGALDSDANATLKATGTVVINNNTLPVTAYILSGSTLVLRIGNQTLKGNMLIANTALMLSIAYPVDGAVYTGS